MEYLGHQLDEFQEKAVLAIDAGRSVIVAAPTGCGKTLIAEYAIERSLHKGSRVVYTAPIKSLSNQKFRDFRARFGEEQVGIHTGDVTMNPGAPVLIMTTEIFRNLILEDSPRLEDVAYVVFDEIHYLDDVERGTVWEECIILAPPHIGCVCLSATVPNVHELAAWMTSVRGVRFEVIEEHQRPVPLRYELFSPRHGIIRPKDVRRLYRRNPSMQRRFQRMQRPGGRLVRMVLDQGRVPVLYFCFRRRACERNAEFQARRPLVNQGERDRIVGIVERLAAQYGLEDYERLGRMRAMWENGSAYHHAGMLPAAKEIVEVLFTEGLIKLLFCTETFALGVNMPAKTVVIDELEKFDGVDFAYLMTRTFNQIAGRAGRRGMDTVGYVYAQLVPEATNPKELERILFGKNERINSRFIASYSTILTLYSRFGEGCYDIFRKSLRNYRAGHFAISSAYQKEESQIRSRIRFLQESGFLDGTRLTEKGALAAKVNGYEIQAAELFFRGTLNDCTPAQLAVVLCGLVTDQSRRQRRDSTGPGIALRFSSSAGKVIRDLRRMEMRHGVAAPVEELDLTYAGAVIAWAGGCTLNELVGYGFAEGDLVRSLRMTVQLLRTMRDAVPQSQVSERMHESLRLINRDAVDAQAQLQVG